MEDIIRKYALQNAVKFGKAEVGSVVGKVIQEAGLSKKDISKVVPVIKETVTLVNEMTVEEREEELKQYKFTVKKEKKKELKLRSPGKRPILRFEPSPSGALHLGHAYVLGLNHLLAKKYKGKFILRIGDTNPENVYLDAYDLIEKDAGWLTSDRIWKVVIQSRRMKIYYKYAEELLKKNHAYVCTCKPLKFRELINNQEICPCRDLTIDEQLSRWKKMFDEYKVGDAVVRIKTDITDPNPALRDWPAFRINDKKHPRVGKKYRVWPLMNFSVAIDDMTLRVTHAIRAKEHMDNAKRQAYIFEYLGAKPIVSEFVGRIHFTGLKMSSSEAKKLIQKGKYTGWDDIKLPFLPALRKRGYTPEAFLHYAEDVGISSRDKKVAKEEYFKTLDSFNKEILEKRSNRYFFVGDPKKIIIKDVEEGVVKVPLHPDDKKRGSRVLHLSKNVYVTDKIGKGNYRLIGGCNFKDKKFISLKHDASLKARLIQWVSEKDKIKGVLVMPDGEKVKGFVEKNILKENIGSVVQLVRMGFARIDKKGENSVELWFGHK